MRTRHVLTAAAIVVGLIASVAGPAAADHEFTYTPTDTKLYMRNDGGGCPGRPFLSVVSMDGEPGCGYVGGLPFGELYHAGAPVGSTVKTYTTDDGVPAFLDATRDVAGNVRVVATAQTNRMAVGQIRVDLTLRALTRAGQSLTLGTHSSEQIVNPTNSAEVDFPFTIALDDALDTTELTQVAVDVDIRGVHVLTGYHRLNGQSWLDLPTYERTPIPH